MIIIGIEDITAKKRIVTLSSGDRWPVYDSDIRKYKLTEGMALGEDIAEEVYSDVVLRRAKLKTLNILKTQDKTEKQLRDKLTRDGYDEKTIGDVFEYLDRFHYVDDRRLAENYCEFHKDGMSRLALKQKLLAKGVDSGIVSDIIDNSEINEEDTLRKMIEKKGFNETITDSKAYQKAVSFLMRRGYAYEMIKRCLNKEYDS